MIQWLDFWCFGGGHGLSQPYFDGKFYWLVDTKWGERKKRYRLGQFYKWFGGFGAQLYSFQWTHPLAGEERILFGETFRVFGSRRTWFRVMVSWECASLKIKEAEDIRKLKEILEKAT